MDLGVYLSEIASAVMRAHAVEGIHLDLQVDTWPVSIDVAEMHALAKHTDSFDALFERARDKLNAAAK